MPSKKLWICCGWEGSLFEHEGAAHEGAAHEGAAHDVPEHDEPEHDEPEHEGPAHDLPAHDGSEHAILTLMRIMKAIKSTGFRIFFILSSYFYFCKG